MDTNGHEKMGLDRYGRQPLASSPWIGLAFATASAVLLFAVFGRPGSSVARCGGQASNGDQLVLFSRPFASIRG
jgi:hypothetical protein